MDQLLNEIRKCGLCKAHLPCPPRPVIQASPNSQILIIGQAPGSKVQQSGIPWSDASGRELRRWLGVSEEQFYDPVVFGLIPMGFCYPGKGRAGDLPPRPECAPMWHSRVISQMKQIRLTLLIGTYAHRYYLDEARQGSLTENVRNFRSFLPAYLPLVHPSPRNRIWQKKNPWFEEEVVPELQDAVNSLLVQT